MCIAGDYSMEKRYKYSEDRRLQIVQQYAILDTLAEKSYDDITLLASMICDAPMSTISIVDEERSWYKSKLGVESCQTDRDSSFCGQAVLNPTEPFIINDAIQDNRFINNQLVVDHPHIRFYAGVPLLSPDGYAIGTLCVLDKKPRSLSPERLKALEALSRMVISQMELDRLTKMLEFHCSTCSLTGIPNRYAFDSKLALELEQAKKDSSPLSLLLIDVDCFKNYNDQFGHISGDDVLRQVAEVMSGVMRMQDFLGRFGGEEFAAILPNTDANQAIAIAERIRASVEKHKWLNKNITVSIGVSCSNDVIDFSLIKNKEFIDIADKSLYKAKEHGRNMVYI